MDRVSPEIVAALRKLLLDSTDDDLERFLSGHAVGTIAGHLVAEMPPEVRRSFLQQMAVQYPDPGPPSLASDMEACDVCGWRLPRGARWVVEEFGGSPIESARVTVHFKCGDRHCDAEFEMGGTAAPLAPGGSA